MTEMGFLSLIKRKPPARVEPKPPAQGKVVPFVTRRTEITVEREWTELVVRPEAVDASTEESPVTETEPPGEERACDPVPEIELPNARLQLPRTKFQHRSPVMKSTSLSLCKRALGLLLILALATGAHALGNPTPTIANNTFASVAVGQSQTQTVTLTLTSATAIKSIALATGTAASSEYKLNSVTGCTVDGATVNTSGTVCNLSVTYTPLYAGSLASPRLSRNAQLLYTDASSNVTAYGLSGAATKAIPHVVPGTINLFAGQPYTVSGTAAADNGLGNVTGGYVGNSVAATAATFNFAPYNTILATGVAADGTQPMAYDSQGNLYVIDQPNFIIRKIDNTAQHIITTIAGTAGSQGYSGNGGLATAAKLYSPHAITLDAAGNIYFLDNSGVTGFVYPPQIIRRIDAVTGIITAIAGQNFTGTYDAADGGGTCNLATGSQVPEYECGDGGLATYAYLADTGYLVLDSAGNFYLSSSSGTGLPVVRKITTSTGDITTIETPTTLLNTTGAAEGGLTMASDGNLYMIVYDTSVPSFAVVRINPTTLAVTAIAGTSATQTVASCSINNQQSGIAANTISLGTGASQNAPGDLTSDASGNLYVTDELCTEGVGNFENAIFRINIAGDLEFTEVIDRGTQSATALTGYNAYSLYYIQPVAAVPDNNGNLYFITYNQIGVLQGTKAALDFGTVTDYQSSTEQTVSYINIGNGSSSAPPYSFAGGTNFVLSETGDALACDAQTSLAAGAVCDLDIVFSPVAAGAITDTLNVSSGAETVALTGTGVAQPRAGVTPPNLAFGNQAINTTSAPLYFTITDTGTANLVLSGYFPYVPNNADYAVVTGAGAGTCATSGAAATLTPGQSCTVGITFTPNGPGSLPSTFYLNTNASFGTVATMSGTGITATPAVTFNPTSFSFGSQIQGSTSTPTVVQLTNSGGGTLTISGITITGTNAAAFVLSTSATNPCGNTLAAGASCNISVAFDPNAVGLLSANISVADNATGSPQTVPLTGTGTSTGLVFNPAPVNVAPASAQTLVATFVIDSGTSVVTPIASMHYGINYSAGTVSCSGGAGNQTCMVPVAFLPIYPGGRKDALVITAGATTLTIQVYGVGQAPFALIDGGVITNPISNGTNYLYSSTVGEDGTVYVISGGSSVQAVTKAGVVSTLPITGISGPTELATDGAGTLYISNSGQANSLITYNPATGQGTYNFGPPTGDAVCQGGYGPETYPIGVATGIAGDIYILDVAGYQNNGCPRVDYFKRDGTSTGTTISPSITQAAQVAVDSSENVFVSGYTTNEIPVGGTQTEINVNSGSDGVGIDAAGTLYMTRYTGNTGVAMVAASNYAQQIDSLDNGAPLGDSIGPDGTVYVGNYNNLDKVDRSKGSPLSFGAQQNGTASSPQSFRIYNGGNQSLTISNFTISGTGFSATSTGVTSPCSSGLVLAPGALCTASVTFLGTHSGSFSGSVSFTTNTLNSTATTQTVTTSATISGIYVTETPTPLSFGNQTVLTSSTAQTVTFTNNGINANASVGTPSSVTGFSINRGTCTGTIAPGASCSMSVTFSPTLAQPYSGNIGVTFGSDASTQTQTVTIGVSGTGTAAAAPAATLSGIAFGNQTQNTTSSAMSATLTNTGSATLTISNIAITGNNPINFTLSTGTNACGTSLSAGASCSIYVTFSPTTVTTYNATLSITDNATGSPTTSALSGTGTAPPAPTATLSGIAFGNQTQSTTSSAMSATLTNTSSTSSLTISNIAIVGTNFNLSTGTNACGTSLSAGASCSIYVTFSPTSVATYSATLSVTDNATGSPTTSALSGAGTAPAVTLSPIAFPNTPEGTTSSPISATLTNTGNATLTISNIAIVGTNFALAIGGTCGSSLTAGSSCLIPVTFSPVGPTGYSATLSVTDNATGSPQTSALTGTGTYVKPTVTLLPSPFVYANTTVGQKSAAQVFTLTNTGTSPFNFTTALSDTTDFAIAAATCGTTLTPGQSCTVSVLFQPQSPTTISGNLTLADYGDALNAVAIFSGTGVAAVVPAPVASLTSSLAFPNTTQGQTSASLSATLSNTGNATLNITNIALGGTNATDFAIVTSTNPCGGTLAAGASCLIAATFTPLGTSSYTATITVTDNSATPTQSATLTGTGLAVVVADFGISSNTPSQTVIGGSAAQYNLAVSSVGGTFSGAVSFTATGLQPGATVSFNPATVSPGSSSASTVMSIQTVPTLVKNTAPSNWPWLAPTAVLAFVVPFLWWRRRKQHGLRLLSLGLLMALLSSASMVLAGCGAGFSLPLGNSVYVITVTATSGATTHSTTVVLTVQ